MFQGRFEILSLGGSYLVNEEGGSRSRNGGMSVSLSGPEGHVIGGGIGMLIAASLVQVLEIPLLDACDVSSLSSSRFGLVWFTCTVS